MFAFKNIRRALSLFFETQIWDSADIGRALKQRYDQIFEELQLDLPLKRIWVLVDQG